MRASGPTKGILSSSQGCAESSRGFRQSNARMEAVILRSLAPVGLLQDQAKVSPSSSDLATVAGDSATQGRPNEEFSGTSVGACSPRQVRKGLQLSQRKGNNLRRPTMKKGTGNPMAIPEATSVVRAAIQSIVP